MKTRIPLLLLAVLSLTGCDFFRPEPVALSILGYNYTGRYIHTFSVNGQWGGNLYEESAGGSIVCCLSFRPDSKLPFDVEVEWTFGREEDDKGNITRPQEHRKATATVTGPLPKNKPSNFEVHFMPDGSVQAYVTHFMSFPFLLPDGKPNPNIRVVPPGDVVLPSKLPPQ
jgi:hypothetical protein